MRSTNRAATGLFLATLFIAGVTRVLGAEPAVASVDELRNAIAAGKYDDLAGDYQLSAYMTITVTREGKQLFGQAGGGQYLDLVPEAADHFVIVDAKAKVTFVRDAAGKVTELTLQQGPTTTSARRLTVEEATAIKDALAKRIAENKPTLGMEALLRRHIEAMRTGQPTYDMMSPALAAAIKAQLPTRQSRLAQIGAIRAIEFKGVAPNGLDSFEVTYERGSTQYVIGLGADGKIASLGVQVVQ
jgi:hypothetical protein